MCNKFERTTHCSRYPLKVVLICSSMHSRKSVPLISITICVIDSIVSTYNTLISALHHILQETKQEHVNISYIRTIIIHVMIIFVILTSCEMV